MVILIRSHPGETGRAAEGIRIALGLAASEHHVEVILMNQAPRLLTAEIEEYPDGERTIQFLSSLMEFVPRLYIDEGSPVNLSESKYVTARLSIDEVSKKIAEATCFSLF